MRNPFSKLDDTSRAYLEIHTAVILFGFTAIFGELIQLPALLLVWWRVLFTIISLLLLVRAGSVFRDLSGPVIMRFMGIGIVVACQWLTFYGAIKLSNASLTLVAMATTSFFTALAEPLIMRQKAHWHELGLGLLIIPGMLLVVRNTDFSMLGGLGMGLLSAMLAALFTTLNKKLIGQTDTIRITFIELGTAWLFFSLVLPIYFLSSDIELHTFWPRPIDLIYLLLLAIFCTTFAYVLALRSLRHLSAFASNLTVNLEPIYGLILAWLILKEHEDFSSGFYWGVAIIMGAVFGYPLLKKKLN